MLTENIAYNNTENGLNLHYSDNTTLLRNNVHKNFQNGIYFFFSDNCTILDNDIKENQQDGLNLYQSDNNTISGNIISDNVNRGIFLDDNNSGSDYNTIYNNFFVNNGIHAIDETSNNYWNSAVIGNYWDNYTGVDDDNDGIGDSPHIFTGGTDYLPIWDDDPPQPTPGGIPGYDLILFISVLFISI